MPIMSRYLINMDTFQTVYYHAMVNILWPLQGIEVKSEGRQRSREASQQTRRDRRTRVLFTVSRYINPSLA